MIGMKTVWLTLLILWLSQRTHSTGSPCSELSRELRYPCRCELDPQEPDNPAILMDCDRVVFPGELPALPYGAPIVAFSQRWAGHQALPPQLFGDSALPLRSVDFSGNALRRLTERMLLAMRGSLLELRLADNLLGDTLNPIFSSSEFHGLTHLQLLDLSGNSIRAIEEGILKGCDNLQELLLDRNSLISIPSTSLNGPRALTQLSLSQNRISTIKSDAFKTQQNIEELDLSDNLISSIEGNAFRNMGALKVLKITKNRLNQFNSDIFNGAHSLQNLNMAENFIAKFPAVAFKAFNELRFLNLSANVIKSLENEELQSVLNLYQLDLSRNNIANIAPGTFLGLKQLRHLDISVNSLRTIEDDAFEGLDNLKTLSLKDNNILLIPASALGRLPRLASLSIDYNRIAALSGDILSSMAERVTSLVLARNVIRELPASTFQHFRQLAHLDLSGNQLSTLAPDTFSGLEKTLETLKISQNKLVTLNEVPLVLLTLRDLDISDNRITELAREVFTALPLLVKLNMSGNPITTVAAIPSGLLHRMPLLNSLDVSRTGLRALPQDLLLKSSSIQEVYASGNEITELNEGAFMNLRNLTHVDLSFNALSNIRPRSFVNTMQIHVLLLNNNKLNSFKGEIFNTGTSLETLDLSGNELGYVYPSSFKIHPRLRWVSVAGNKLTYFPAELISGLQFLEYVDLSGNLLKSVVELDFGRLPRLRSLNLASNQLASISEVAFHNSTQLQLIDLSRNKIDRLGDRTFEGLVRLAYLNLEDNQLTELPDTIFERARLQMLENINLAGNKFEVAPLKSLQRQYFFVSSVDLSRNKLVNIPPDDSVMVNIKKLDLSFNPLSRESITNVLSEPKTVRELNLAGTGITEITRLETPFLRHLNLSHNNITTMPQSAFDRTSLLETLDMSSNQLTVLVPQVWELLKNMQHLDLSSNPILSITQTDLIALDTLRQLRIENLYECTKIEKNAFKSVSNLAELDAFGYPKLGYLDVQGLLVNLPALERLNIETKEPALGAEQLRSVLHPRLLELGVWGSRLKTISSGAFSGLKAPTLIISLCNTSLSALPPALFFPVPRSSIVKLDLAHSLLTTLTGQTLTALEDRRGDLEIHGLDTNPIQCDCNARAFRKWLLMHNIQINCSTPEYLSKRILNNLSDNELTCNQRTTDFTQSTDTTIFTVSTKATTEPEIIWSVMSPPKPKPKITQPVSTGNDDTLIIAIVGGVVAFIAILIIAICVIRLRTGNSYYNGALPTAMGPVGPASSCACSVKGAPQPMYGYMTGTMPPGGYAATLPHKMHQQGGPPQQVPRHAFSTVGRVPPYYQNAPQPYFIGYPPEEKGYR